MKAIVINQFGNADTFYETELPQTQITPDTVAVAINAFSINPMDIAARAGYLQSPFTDNWTFPLVLGWDFSGTITQVGQNVTKYHIGDQVFGTLPSNHAATPAHMQKRPLWIRPVSARFLLACPLIRQLHCRLLAALHTKPLRKILMSIPMRRF